MTQSTKLEIIGPYTPEHEGPFCTRDGAPARILCADMKNEYSIVAVVLGDNGKETVSAFLKDGKFSRSGICLGADLMNAREVPVAREFWINQYAGGGLSVYLSNEEAQNCNVCLLGTIHVREVLPGEPA